MKELTCIVCGMKINDKNYEANKYSFIEKNSIDNIIYCPFCGAGKSYILSEEEVYHADLKELDAETLKVLDNAMKLEVFNGEFYKEASKMASSEEVRNTFEALSSIELMHARIHMRLGGFKKLPVLHKPDYSRLETDEKLLMEGAKREKHAVHFYERNDSKVTNKVIKQVLKALTEVEMQHIVLTELDR